LNSELAELKRRTAAEAPAAPLRPGLPVIKCNDQGRSWENPESTRN